jgi:hypothetical protein
MLRRINPEDIDYGAVFEERNRALRSLLGMNEHIEVARSEVKRLKNELETKAALIAEMSLQCTEPVATNPNLSVNARLVDRINELEYKIREERRKNLRLKGTSLHARNT